MRSHRGPGSDGLKVGGGAVQTTPAPGKRTLTESLDAAASAGSGQPLPGPLQAKFGRTLGADLSSVRVHTGDASASAAEAMQAKAFTTGQDIHFGAGKYDPSSSAGEHLLAHEVVHTVQQGSSHAEPSPQPQAKLEIGEPGGAAEREADALAAIGVEGSGTATVTERPPAGGHVVQRDLISPEGIDLTKSKTTLADGQKANADQAIDPAVAARNDPNIRPPQWAAMDPDCVRLLFSSRVSMSAIIDGLVSTKIDGFPVSHSGSL